MPQLKAKQQWKRSSNVGDDVPMTEDGYMSTDFTEISDPNKSNLCSATEELAIICSIWIALPLLVSKFEMTSCVVIWTKVC